ncbi:transposase [Inhella sp. 1Y17]|uniref:Transposase n=1 Tax=Inhella proteolytica TaxID=2795029 RepID=A0A931J7F7_9BURK|nr:transposase [Inhella proteolytica]
MRGSASEFGPFWSALLRRLLRRGLRRISLLITDSPEGLRAAATKVLTASGQRGGVRFIRNARARARKTQRRKVSAAIATAFA